MRHRTTDTAKGHRNYIIIACDVLLFLAMLKWLPVEPEVARGLAVLTFIGILWLTEALHVTVTALLVPVLAMFMGILPGAKALAGFADPTIFLFFGGFALAGALHEQKIDTWLAGKILRMARGSLGMALILIFLATAFLSMWMSNTATAAMMLPLVIGLLDRIPAEKLKTTAPFAVLGVAYSASIGGMGTLVGSPPMGQSPIIILLIISLFITSLTEFCSNTASAALVAPLMVTVASAMGMSATPLVLLVGIGASCAFMLPVSTPPNALAFATGKFPQMTMVKVGLLINVVLVFVKAFWAWIFWM